MFNIKWLWKLFILFYEIRVVRILYEEKRFRENLKLVEDLLFFLWILFLVIKLCLFLLSYEIKIVMVIVYLMYCCKFNKRMSIVKYKY